MKKSLLLISIGIALTTVSCNNTESKTNDVTSEETNKTLIDTSKVSINSTPITQDTPHVGGQAKAKVVGKEQGIKKDTVKPPTKGTAIIHSAPNQAKIDSIKKAKLKLTK